ncbi:MAG: magnesium transporter, partial [Dietzia cercidiphylli]
MTEPRDLPDDPGGPPTDATGFALVDEHVDENSTYGEMSLDEATRRLARLRSRGDLRAASRLMASLPDQVVVDMFERSADRD